jgi:hypothetical protein
MWVARCDENGLRLTALRVGCIGGYLLRRALNQRYPIAFKYHQRQGRIAQGPALK